MTDAARLRLLSDTLDAFAESTGDYQRLLETVVERTGKALDVFCVVGLLSADEQLLVPVASWGKDPDAVALFRALHARSPLKVTDPHPANTVLKTGTPFFLRDVDNGPMLRLMPAEFAPMLERYPLRSTLACPLRAQGKTFGTLSLNRYGLGSEPLDEADRDLAQSLASHAALAISNAKSLGSARSLERRLRVLTAATRAFVEVTSDYRTLLDTVARHISQVMGCFCGITLLSEDGRQLAAEVAHAADPEVLRVMKARTASAGRNFDENSPVFQIIRRGATVVAAGEPLRKLGASVSTEGIEQFDRLAIKGAVHVPLRAQGKTLGLFSLARCGVEESPFDPDDVSLAENLADHAAVAIYNSQLMASERASRAAAELELDRRQRAEHALRKTEDLLEAAPDAMVIVAQDGKIQLVNGQVERMFGYAREELLGQPVEILVPQQFRGRHPMHRTGYTSDPRARPMGAGLDLRAVRKDGSEFPAEISLSPMHDERGTLVTAAIRDVTDRKQLELKMLEASRLKSEFLANMSHELRTPLNAIIGFTELMHKGKAGPLSEPQAEYLGDVLTSARHLLQLINDVLDLSKIESGKMEFHPEETDLARVVAEIRDVLRGLSGAKRLEVTTQVDVPNAVIDPGRFKQILYNYLSNAIKFTAEGGKITIRVVREGSDAFRLDVADTGIGIPADMFGKLFVEFQQLDASRAKKFQGTGLGLALTRRIAEAHGGRVEVKSTVGLGSTFSAVLPLVTRTGEEPDRGR